MSKGEETKSKILQQGGELFSKQRYAGSFMSNIMRVTGLQKGGIYNHFQSKDDLTLQAFDFAIACINQHTKSAFKINSWKLISMLKRLKLSSANTFNILQNYSK